MFVLLIGTICRKDGQQVEIEHSNRSSLTHVFTTRNSEKRNARITPAFIVPDSERSSMRIYRSEWDRCVNKQWEDP